MCYSAGVFDVCATARECPPPADQKNGARDDCPEPFTYNSVCKFECNKGFKLPVSGVATLTCGLKAGTNEVEWDDSPTACVGGWVTK